MSDSEKIITTIVCPLIGLILANFMWITPLPVILQARYTRNIGLTNPYPFVITILNCIGWTIYGCLKKDFFIFFSNAFGIVLGLYYTIVSLTVIAKKKVDADFSDVYLGVESLLLFAVFFWSMMGLVASTAFENAANPLLEATNLIGNISSAFAIAYYAAPLSTMAQVLAKRDASTLYLPMILVNLTNASMWFLYGAIGVGDINIYGPNGIGAILAGIQLSLCLLLPSKERKEGQTWGHIWLLLQGKIPPTFETSEKIGKRGLLKSEDSFDEELPI